MSISQYGDFETFLMDNGNRLFRYWVYRRMFTPYEQDKKFMDETEYDQTHAHLGFIRESIELPNGDFLLGIQEVFDDLNEDEEDYVLDYYRLSELRIGHYPGDIKQLLGEVEYGT